MWDTPINDEWVIKTGNDEFVSNQVVSHQIN